MSRRNNRAPLSPERTHAPLFAALGDRTRLRLVGILSGGEPRSISELAGGFKLTRQAVTKHLRILEDAGVVQGEREGREVRFAFTPTRIEAAKKYLEQVSAQWDAALGRLKSFVESDSGPPSK